jgi:hypothetical protein
MGSVAFSSSSITIDNTSGSALAAQSAGDLTVSGVTVDQTGLASSDGVQLAAQGNLAATNDSLTFTSGTTDDVLNAISSGGNVLIGKDTLAANDLVDAGISGTAVGSFTIQNTSVVLNAGITTAVQLSGNSGNPDIIENDTFSTSGHGDGLMFTGGSGVEAFVQDVNFQNNKIGVEISGDGTNAGIIDLGGGPLGSQGGNNFKGFNGVNGHFAIILSNTSSTSTISALGDLFSVANPLNAVQDGAENSQGFGTGLVTV